MALHGWLPIPLHQWLLWFTAHNYRSACRHHLCKYDNLIYFTLGKHRLNTYCCFACLCITPFRCHLIISNFVLSWCVNSEPTSSMPFQCIATTMIDDSFNESHFVFFWDYAFSECRSKLQNGSLFELWKLSCFVLLGIGISLLCGSKDQRSVATAVNTGWFFRRILDTCLWRK